MDSSEIDTLFGQIDINKHFTRVLKEHTEDITDDVAVQLRELVQSSKGDEGTVKYLQTLDTSPNLTFKLILDVLAVESDEEPSDSEDELVSDVETDAPIPEPVESESASTSLDGSNPDAPESFSPKSPDYGPPGSKSFSPKSPEGETLTIENVSFTRKSLEEPFGFDISTRYGEDWEAHLLKDIENPEKYPTIKNGDRIEKVNGIDVTDMHTEQIEKIINSELTVDLEILIVNRDAPESEMSDMFNFHTGNHFITSEASDYKISDFHEKGRLFKDYGFLERSHNYIQWLFPLIDKSPHNPNAVLNLDEVELFKSDRTVQENLVKSLVTMMDFYGATLVTEPEITITHGEEKVGVLGKTKTEERLTNMNDNSHNRLRVTRILSSLKLLGREDLQKVVYDYFNDMVDKNPYRIEWKDLYKESLKDYWTPTIETEVVEPDEVLSGPPVKPTRPKLVKPTVKPTRPKLVKPTVKPTAPVEELEEVSISSILSAAFDFNNQVIYRRSKKLDTAQYSAPIFNSRIGSEKLLIVDVIECQTSIYPVVFYLSKNTTVLNVIQYMSNVIDTIEKYPERICMVKGENYQVEDYHETDRVIMVSIKPHMVVRKKKAVLKKKK